MECRARTMKALCAGFNASRTQTRAYTPASATVVPINTTDVAATAADVAATAIASATAAAAAISQFGGHGMPPKVAQWCAAELSRIQGSGDLTLADFCYALESEAEIRAYFEQYLGTTAEVTQFVLRFIKLKQATASRQKKLEAFPSPVLKSVPTVISVGPGREAPRPPFPLGGPVREDTFSVDEPDPVVTFTFEKPAVMPIISCSADATPFDPFAFDPFYDHTDPFAGFGNIDPFSFPPPPPPAACKHPRIYTPTTASTTTTAAAAAAISQFGGHGMPSEVAQWYAAELSRIQGSGDLTLADFCYALESEAEIRAYFEQYLGTTAEVKFTFCKCNFSAIVKCGSFCVGFSVCA
jgi:hypothetical protein